MKWKIALALSLTSIISTNSMAMEITKGKLLSHKEWSTGKTQASFKESTSSPIMNQLFAKALKHRNEENPPLPFADFIFSMAHIDDVVIDPLTNDVTIEASTNTGISNTTNSSHLYTIKTQVCLNTMFPNDNCATSMDLLATDPGGNIGSYRHPVVNFHSINTSFIAVVETTIYRDGSDSVFSTMGYMWGDISQPIPNHKK